MRSMTSPASSTTRTSSRTPPTPTCANSVTRRSRITSEETDRRVRTFPPHVSAETCGNSRCEAGTRLTSRNNACLGGPFCAAHRKAGEPGLDTTSSRTISPRRTRDPIGIHHPYKASLVHYVLIAQTHHLNAIGREQGLTLTFVEQDAKRRPAA